MKKLLFLSLLCFSFSPGLFGQGEGEARKKESGIEAGQKSIGLFMRVHVGTNVSSFTLGSTGPRVAYKVRNQKLNQHRIDGGFAFGAGFATNANSSLYLGVGYEYQWFWRRDKSRVIQPYLGVGSDLSYQYGSQVDFVQGRNHVHRLVLTPRIVPGMEIHFSKKMFLDFAVPINPVGVGSVFQSNGAPRTDLFNTGSAFNVRLGLGFKF